MSWNEFWELRPALLIGIGLFLGLSFYFHPTPLILIPLIPLLIHPHRHLFGALALAFAGYFYAMHTTQLPIGDEAWQGSAFVEVVDVKEEMKFGKRCAKLRLHLERFCDAEQKTIAKNMTLYCVWKNLHTRPSGGTLYKIEGTLKKSGDCWYSLSPKEGSCQAVESRFSFVELRYQIKQCLKRFLDTKLQPPHVTAFLQGLFLGEFHDAILGENLRRFGLSHIMVVSGFHFSLMVAFLLFFIRFTLPWRASLIAVVTVATLYLIFIGPTASVMRAWVAVTLLFIGKFCEKRANGLNSLGVALIVLLLYEPTWCQSLGFQLSFLATGAILLFYAPVDQFLSRFFKTRTFSEAIEMSVPDQLLYMILIFFRKSTALSIAVNIFMIPACFFYFQQFAFLSLLYNLFFPLLTSLCLFLFCLALLCSFWQGLSDLLFKISCSMTELSLQPVLFLPRSFDITLTLLDMPAWLFVTLLTLGALGGILLHQARREEKWLFSYA